MKIIVNVLEDQQEDLSFKYYAIFGDKVAPWDATDENSIECASEKEAHKLKALIEQAGEVRRVIGGVGRVKRKVFLGGTCANSTWRNDLMPELDACGIEYFNPVVEDWNQECIAIEENEKTQLCDIHLYTITSEMIGVYSIAEVVESVFNKDKRTVFHIMTFGFGDKEIKSLRATGDLVARNGGDVFYDIEPENLALIVSGT